MKKVFLLAAFGVAGMMSANNISSKEISDEWCGTVTYQTSCGFSIEDSYCTRGGQNCLEQSLELFDEYFCAP